ncbi:hypothetical protein HPB52_002627 [Rhipicephalus sanguineus]|uniref:Uncharacterized protein n=1 Tax=Rhipicephalus sanguineus TaxID=34632 RepID=A0A9D4Q4I3_RHISA|nr:hypothetical protein HPB52_002627 [Rhipicephalus sanguineus]
MSAVAVPKRNRRRKRKPKHCSTSGTTRSGLSHLPFNTRANFLRLLALFEVPQKAEQEQCQCVVGGGDPEQVAGSKSRSKTVSFPTPPKLPNDKPKAKIGSPSFKHLNKNKCKISSSKSAECEATFVEDDVVVRDEPVPTPPTQIDVEDFVRQPRKILQKNGPFQEDNLLKALCTSQAQIIISAYGTITSFLDRCQGFQVLYEELYTFVFCKCTDDEDGILDAGAAVSCIRRSNKIGLQNWLVGGDGLRRTSIFFSSSPSGEGVDKQERCRMKHGWTQVPWLPPYSSRALQAVRQTCEAEVQAERCSTARLAEVKFLLQEREKRVTELKERLCTTRESQPREAQQLRDKIELLKAAAPPPPRRVNEVRKSEQPTGTNAAQASYQLPRPRLPQRQRSPPRWLRVEEKPRLLCFGQTARLGPPHRRGTQAPRPRTEKRRARPVGPTVNPLSPLRRRTPSPWRNTRVKARALRFEQMARLLHPMRGRTSPQTKAEVKSRARTLGLMAQLLYPLRHTTPPPRRKADRNSLACGQAARIGLATPPGTRSPRPRADENLRGRHLGQNARLLYPLRRGIASPRRKAEGSRHVLPFGQAARIVPPMRRETSSRPKVEKSRTQRLPLYERPRGNPVYIPLVKRPS